MNETTPFIFNNHIYYVGTIVEINEEWKQNFRFNSTLKFTGYDVNDCSYCFTTLQDNWKIYKLSEAQIQMCVKSVLLDGVMEPKNEKIDPKYIDGIVSAWIWYILIMFFALFLKGAENVIGIWIIATFLFFGWRHNKIKGG